MSANNTTNPNFTRRSDHVVSKLVDRLIARYETAPEKSLDRLFYQSRTKQWEKDQLRQDLTLIVGRNYPNVRGIVGTLGDIYKKMGEFTEIEKNDPEWGDVDCAVAWAPHAVQLQLFLEEIIPEVEDDVPPILLDNTTTTATTSIDLKTLEEELQQLHKQGKTMQVWARLDELSSPDLHTVLTKGSSVLRYLCSPIHEWECYNRHCAAKIYLKDLHDMCLEFDFPDFDIEKLQQKICDAQEEQLNPMAMGYGSMRLNDCKYYRKGDSHSTLEITKVSVRLGYTRLKIEVILPEYLMAKFVKKYATGQEYLLRKREVIRPPNQVNYTWKQLEYHKEVVPIVVEGHPLHLLQKQFGPGASFLGR